MSSTTTCAACGGHVPLGRFCAVCGQPLTTTVPGADATRAAEAAPPQPLAMGPAATDLMPVTEPQAFPYEGSSTPAPEVPSAPRTRRSSRTVGVATITAALLAVGAYVVFNGTESHTVTGDLSLTDTSAFASRSPGDSCQGSGGYGDIAPGTEVIVEDENGKTLATGHFGDGSYDGAACVFDFSFSAVPKAAFYRFSQSGNRGELQYSYDEMVKNNWAVHLTLGN